MGKVDVIFSVTQLPPKNCLIRSGVEPPIVPGRQAVDTDESDSESL